MIIRQLTDDEQAALADGLALAARLVDGLPPLSADQVQALYDALCSDHPNDAEGIIAAGLAFGELIAARADYEWVRVADDFGEETVLAPRNKEIICAPVSMIQKRIEEREAVSIPRLRDATIATVQQEIDDGDVPAR